MRSLRQGMSVFLLLAAGLWGCDDAATSGGGAGGGDGSIGAGGGAGGTGGTGGNTPRDDQGPDAEPTVDAAPPGCACDDAQVCDDAGACRDRCALGACPGGHCGPAGLCVEGPCTADDDCAGDAWCDEGRCKAACAGDVECGLGRVCQGGRCVDDPDCRDAEICGNGVDDDCNGVRDDPDVCGDCRDGADCDTGLGGNCTRGQVRCQDGEAVCELVPPGDPESCNDQDDDCDGMVDEDFADVGAACEGGVGQCAGGGTLRCSADGQNLECGGFDALAGDELCDGLDNDCDGRTDEAFPDVGQACQVGQGRCAAAGVVQCSDDGALAVCDAMGGEGQPELCDGVDNDCDGRTDEDPDGQPLARDCYGGAEATRGVGVCRAGRQTCTDGAYGACEGEVLPSGEMCNGADDDCNGVIDDDGRDGPLVTSCYAGPEGTDGVGPCRAGRSTCLLGRAGPCVGAVTPSDEICDQEDNDCDGAVDDVEGGCPDCEPGSTRACYTGPANTQGVGSCRAGTQSCGDDGTFGPCQGQTVPAAEVCDGADNDCSGIIDDGLEGLGEACEVGQGACAGEGTIVCDPRAGLVCDAFVPDAQPEACDAVDNDCDGRVDEDFGAGRPCMAGVGACRRAGVLACDANGELACDARLGQPVAELCDQIDNDCDGLVDETFPVGDACGLGQGQCRGEGVFVCDGPDRAACDVEIGQPDIERCDAADNDCDGQTDEGYGLGAACNLGRGECAVVGARVCAESGGTTCAADAIDPIEEQCNGLDDDCDGRNDEGIGLLGDCDTGVPGTCSVGRARCVGGGVQCDQLVFPRAEFCDGRDNDCDGRVDEGQGTQVCGEGICQRELPRCVDGAPVVCDPDDGALDVELCNGQDDDCDGRTDESTVVDGQRCPVGVGICERVGLARCEDGQRVCDGFTGLPRDERCNGEDDDCDGTIDEGTIQPGDTCTVGVGGCRVQAVPRCTDGEIECPAAEGQPLAEACNGEDDDCDGRVDEGFGDLVECGVGICRRIVSDCSGAACDPLAGARDEICNGLDDDCDGTIDEAVPGEGADCTGGTGQCRYDGTTVCRLGRIQCDGQGNAPAVENCNGLDDDCDGRVDEQPADAGAACSAGRGGCRADGRLVCEGGALVCDARPFQAVPESCNGRDDDCDGATDEAIADVICGRGACRQVLDGCEAGVPPRCDAFAGATLEVCNGVDDDCDGPVDEDAVGDGSPCSDGVGACRRDGTGECVNGQLLCSAQAAPPRNETCDAQDNDCDGEADEGFDLFAECTAGQGVCQARGVRVCAPDGTATCDAQPGPAGVEICNLFDDDCDGRTDEGLSGVTPCQTGQPGVCAAGFEVCGQNGLQQCQPRTTAAAEVCDGLDNDCDGETDEDTGTVACGQGACARDIPACRNGAPAVCDPFLGAAAGESCDGVDEDCDGRVDENAVEHLQPCTVGLGICTRVGVGRCVGGAVDCDVDEGPAQTELCNGQDDDCDGRTDENTRESRQTCGAGEGVCRGEALQLCVDGAVQCPAQANPGAAGDEICDGLDNDCDGTPDEGFGSVVCGVGACRHAVPNCDGGGGAPDCDPLEGASAEVCNGVDDDCDGTTDEGNVAGTGEACISGFGVCQRSGVTVCRDANIVCGAEAGQPGDEVCDARDNDCDGTTDEQPTDVGQPCTAGSGSCAQDGVTVCRNFRVECDAMAAPPGVETCNGTDDDCDGATDERLGNQTCGLGVCRRILPVCRDGGAVACDPFAGARDELCNGGDDDCDGDIDEALGTVTCGQGQCARDLPRCVGGGLTVCDPFQGATGEVCDGRDNDCDGTVDEAVAGVGARCTVGAGGCLAEGTQACVDGAMVCDAELGDPSPELCDLIDNDCDGAVDEDSADVGNRCQSGGVGACNGFANTICRDGEEFCPAVDTAPRLEICDGIDNDCDNFVDETSISGRDCDANGFDDQCDIELGRFGDCNGNRVPDVCDIAGGGSQDCNLNGVPDECNGDGTDCALDDVPPTVELFVSQAVADPGTQIQVIVNAADNRALSSVRLFRDGLEVPLDAFNQTVLTFDIPGLYVLEGVARDFGGNETRDVATVRVRDPRDQLPPELEIHAPENGALVQNATEVIISAQDPNLLIWVLTFGPFDQPDQFELASDRTSRVNTPVAVLDPAAIPEGTWALQLYAEDLSGNTRTLTGQFTIGVCVPEAERCDGADNDCDGNVDEVFAGLGDGCSAGVGACAAAGTIRCLANGTGTACDAQPGPPAAERCDNIDHDCDGQPRNGFATGVPCSAGVGVCARDGTTVCTADGAGVMCDAVPGAGGDEVCNGEDDDCDGEEDEGFQRVTCGVGVCRHTVSECEGGVPGGQLDCDPLEGAGPEMCDGEDDDCDGTTDEGALDVGGPCGVGEGACFREGVTVCAGGDETCGATPGDPADEICNDVDDDCDGDVDEGEVCPDVTDPVIDLRILTGAVNPGQQASFQVLAQDDRGGVQTSLTVGGEAVPLDGQGVGRFTTDEPGVYPVVATATDAAGNTVTATGVLRVFDPDDVTAPIVQITAPDFDAELLEDTEMRGTVTDPNLLEWRIEYAEMVGDEWVTLVRGDQEVVDGRLGDLNVSNLPNGMYRLRVAAEDVNGRIGIDQVSVRADGGAKVGEFRMVFVDLNVPVAGVPITVERVYDSRDRFTRDFGVGWRLNVKGGKMQHNRPEHEEWDVVPGGFLGLPCSQGLETASHITEIRLSDREYYLFRPVIRNPAILLGGCQVTMDYEFVSGKPPGPARLQILGDNTALYIAGSNELTTFDTLEELTLDRARLTTPDGRVFDLHKVDGTFRLADANGNSLFVNDDSLVRDTGQGVDVVRNASGRIVQIVAPSGDTIDYRYDARGDLVEVEDEAGAVTRFVYDAEHYLVEVIDPSGNTPARQIYDDDGRLVAIEYADGRRQELQHDLDNRVEVVVDKLGNPEVFEYDPDGNVVRHVDKAGNVTINAYNANGDVVQRTLPGGASTTYGYDGQNRMIRVTGPVGDERQATYNSGNRFVTQTDAEGRVTARTYDARGNVLTVTDPEGNVTQYTYDAKGRTTTKTNPRGGVTQYSYSAEGYLTEQIDPLGLSTTYTYDADGNRLTETKTRDGVDLTTRYEYDPRDRLVRETDPLGNTIRIEYDVRGRKVAEVDKRGQRTEFVWDDLGNNTEVRHPDGTIERYTYDPEGRRVEVIDRAGRSTTTEYDVMGRPVRVVQSDGSETVLAYDARSNLVREVDARGNETVHEYDAADRRIRTTDAEGGVTRWEYDAVGNVTAIVRPTGQRTEHRYDGNNRRIATLYADGTRHDVLYDGNGNKISETDQAGEVTIYENDAGDRLVRVIDAEGGETRFTYDSLGNVIEEIDALGRVTRYEHDPLGRPIRKQLPGGAQMTAEFDAMGNMVRRTDYNGVTTEYDYDANGRLIEIRLPGGEIETAAYGQTGNRTQVQDGRGLTRWTYDGRDRPVERVDPDGQVVRWTYDAVGNKTSVETLAGTTTYTYDANNRLATVTDPDGGVSTYTYTPAGARASLTLPNGVRTDYTYDQLDRLTGIETRDGGGALLAGYTYTLGPAGNRVRVVEAHSGRQVDYAYDGLYRLVREEIVGERIVTYTYDAVGNRLTRDDSVDGATAYTYDVDDRLVDVDGTAYQYDANGNLTAVGATQYTYDSRDRLVLVEDGALTVSYAYDLDGHRVGRVVDDGQTLEETRYVVDENRRHTEVLAELDGQGNLLTHYVYGADQVSQHRGAVDHFPLMDGQMSVRHLTDGQGSVTDTYDYDAFGRTLRSVGNTPNDLLYNGQFLDPNVGFYYLRARWMDPSTGRFLTVDPVPGLRFDPRTLHRYTYALNSPVDLSDPSGEFTMVSISVSLTIQTNIRSIYVSNLLRTFLTVTRIAVCQLAPAYELRNAGFDAILNGVGAGFEMVSAAQTMIAGAFRAIGGALAATYQNIANELVKFDVKIEVDLNATIDALQDQLGDGFDDFNQGVDDVQDILEAIQKLQDLKAKVSEFFDKAVEWYNTADALLDIGGSHTACEKMKAIEKIGNKLIDFIPKF